MIARVLAAAELDVESLLFLMRSLQIASLPIDLELYTTVHYLDEQAKMDDSVLSRLQEADLIDEDGRVDPSLVNWLRVVEHPDIMATAISRNQDVVRRVVIARRGPHHVMAMQIGNEILLQAIRYNSEDPEEVVTAPLWDSLRLSKTLLDPPAAQMDKIAWQYSLDNLPMYESGIPREIEDGMNTSGPTANVLRSLFQEAGQEATIRIDCRQENGDFLWCSAPVLVVDTPQGRVITATRKDRRDMLVTLGSGTYNRFKTAMSDLVAMTPSQGWF